MHLVSALIHHYHASFPSILTSSQTCCEMTKCRCPYSSCSSIVSRYCPRPNFLNALLAKDVSFCDYNIFPDVLTPMQNAVVAKYVSFTSSLYLCTPLRFKWRNLSPPNLSVILELPFCRHTREKWDWILSTRAKNGCSRAQLRTFWVYAQ